MIKQCCLLILLAGINFICFAQTIVVKGNPLTKSDPSLIFSRFTPGDWQNSNRSIVVESVGYNFFIETGFVPVITVEGSAFYNQEWKKATIRLKNGHDLPDQEIIYLVSYQLMFWKKKTTNDGNQLSILTNEINGVLFDEEDRKTNLKPEFVPGIFEHEGKRYLVYFQLLNDGNPGLVKYHRRKVEFQYEYNNPAGKQSFTASADYYFSDEQGNWQLLISSKLKEQLILAWPHKKSEINYYFETNKVNVKKEKDIIDLFSWLREQLL